MKRSPVSAFLSEHVEFFRQYRRQFHTTGAVVPSSRFLARALTEPFQQHSGPCRVLEVGPGTGAVTRRIVRLLKPQDRLDLVELNESFVDVLKHRFANDLAFRGVSDRSEIYQCPVQEYRASQPYQYIICGLPFNNFPPELVCEIFGVFFELLAPGGVLSYLEYMYMRPLRKAFSNRASRERLGNLDLVLKEYLARHRFRRDWVFVNFPPIWVQHLRHDARTAEKPAVCQGYVAAR